MACPKCSKVGAVVHLGSKTWEKNLKQISLNGPFFRHLKIVKNAILRFFKKILNFCLEC